MEFDGLKQFFGEDGNTAITYEELTKGINEKGIKLADLSLGGYIAKDKFDEQTRKFNDYKSKNDVSKYSDYENLKAEVETLRAEKAEREFLEKINAKKIRPEFQKFVLSEVKGKIDDKTNFDKALENYVTDNPQYVTEIGKKPVFKSSSVPLDGTNENKSTNQKMNALFRSVKK